MNRAFIVEALRTPIGSFGGTLAAFSPATLGALCARATIERSAVPADVFSEVIVGNVLGAGHGMNVARQVGRGAGLPDSVPALTLNRVCGSGLQAVIDAARGVRAGDFEVVLCGGVESMSQTGHLSFQQRWGARLGHAEMRDLLIWDGLTDVFHGCHMGVTAENLATVYGITRAEQDAFALESQKRAQRALQENWMRDEIVPVPIEKKGKPVAHFERDEHPRADTTAESLAALRPAFKKDGTVTAGNASGINDGAAFLVVASEGAVKRHSLRPLAEIEGYAVAGVNPEQMGIGPVPAVRKLLSGSGRSLSQIDLIEANEAFAVQALAVAKELEWDPTVVNVGGGAIALGHPIGASGARILVTLLHHLQRLKKERGIATLCVGGGQGVALEISRA